MDASIIVTTYNQSAILIHILNSLLNQRTKFNFEILICDDGSEEDNYSIIRRYFNNSGRISITYLYQQDRGFRAGQARNMGLNRARGKIAILLDGDMVPDRYFVQKHISFHKINKGHVLTGGRLVIDDLDFFREIKPEYHIDKIIKKLSTYSTINKEEYGYRHKWAKSDKPWMSIFSCNLSFPLSKNARYSEKFIGWGIEDWDIGARLYMSGHTVVYDNDIMAYHVNYKPVISNVFRNNQHAQLAAFARNVLLLIDQYPDLDLDDCALALRNYRIKNDKLSWSGDGNTNALRTNKEAVVLFRGWLDDNGYYSKKDTFYIQKPYSYMKIVNFKSIACLDANNDDVNTYIEFVLADSKRNDLYNLKIYLNGLSSDAGITIAG